MASVQIPPWLSIDPIEPAKIELAARAQRAQRAQAELQAQIAREKMQQDALQTAENLQAVREQREIANAQRQQELDQLAVYRAEESQRKQQEGAALERLRQQKYEQDAITASQRLEGMRDYQERIAKGEKPMEAFAANAHKILWQHPEKAAALLGQQGPLTEQKTEGGAAYLGRPGGRPYFVPRTSLPMAAFEPTLKEIAPGLSGVQTGPNRFQVIPEGNLSQMARSRLTDLRTQERRIAKSLEGLTEEDAAADPELTKVLDKLGEIQKEKEKVYRGDWKPGESTTTAPPPKEKQITAEVAREFMRQAGGDKAKARQLAKDAGYKF